VVVAAAVVVLVVAIVLLWNKGGTGSTASFCASLRQGENPLDVFDRYDPTNVDTARTQLQQGVERLKQLQRAAPGEIRDDMGVLVDVAQQLVTSLDPAATDRTVPDFSSQFDRVQTASATVTGFASSKCGIVLDSSSTTSTTLPAGTPGSSAN
jgi:hypothetical protein